MAPLCYQSMTGLKGDGFGDARATHHRPFNLKVMGLTGTVQLGVSLINLGAKIGEIAAIGETAAETAGGSLFAGYIAADYQCSQEFGGDSSR